jgi:OmpA-OmpF porin, OOP family
MRHYFYFLVLVLAVSLASGTSHAARNMSDQVGAKDHPLIGRFAGSTLFRFGELNFEQVEIGVGAGKRITIEGRVQNYMYYGPSDRTDLEIYRNFKEAVERGGFKVVFACEKQESCKATDRSEHAKKWTRDSKSFIGGYSSVAAMGPEGRDPRYLVAKLERPEGAITAVLTTTSETSSSSAGGKAHFLQVIEEKAVSTGQMTVSNAEELRSKLQNDGKVAVYGVQFATGKSEVLPESKPQLTEMAKYLQGDPNLRVFVIGHTDSQGALEANLTLSQQRAEAVVKALVVEFKIDAKRLIAKGIASFSPVTTNSTDNGRAKNRRVELVIQ